MTDRQIALAASVLKIALAFVNAFAGILAAYPGPELSPLARVLAAATVAGCGAALLYLRPPNTNPEAETLARRYVEQRIREHASERQASGEGARG